MISPTDAWAVGLASFAHRSEALVLRWDGWRWSRAATPALPGTSYLNGVAADGAIAWAVGVTERGGIERAIAIRWTGTAWRRTAVPEDAGRPWDVTMRGRVPWVVGRRSGSDHAFSMRRGVDGWRSVATPRAGGFLMAVAAQRDGDLWAVNFDAIFRRSDGRWHTVRRFAVGTSGIDLTFPSSTDGWIVGGKPTGGEWQAPLPMRRHGSTWARYPVPSDGSAATLIGVDGTPHDVWAVGLTAGYEGPAPAFHYC